MYKMVDPLEVFNQLVSLAQPPDMNGAAALEAQKRVARNRSVLDAVLENATRTRARLGVSDQRRMDEFLESVPSLPPIEQSAVGARQTTETYDKGLHADAMNDLVTMAFECDVTRVISYMLEDERSEFTYDHVEVRSFTAESSTPKGGSCPEYHAAQHHGGDNFASITWWNVGKVAELCRKLDAVEEAPGVSVLDNCVVLFGGSMHGGDHRANELPVALIGGNNLGLKNDQHVVLSQRPLRDLYFTLLNDVFGLGVENFGQNLTGAPAAAIAELLQT
jgi:hypothetical protein